MWADEVDTLFTGGNRNRGCISRDLWRSGLQDPRKRCFDFLRIARELSKSYLKSYCDTESRGLTSTGKRNPSSKSQPRLGPMTFKCYKLLNNCGVTEIGGVDFRSGSVDVGVQGDAPRIRGSTGISRGALVAGCLRAILALIPLADFVVKGCKTLRFSCSSPSFFFIRCLWFCFGAGVTYLVVKELQNGYGLVRLGGGLATLPPEPGGCEVLHFEDLSPLTGRVPTHIPTVLLELMLWDWPRDESSVPYPRRTGVYPLRFGPQIPGKDVTAAHVHLCHIVHHG